jgi:hypothetical protein
MTHEPTMEKTSALQAFTKAVHDYRTSQLQMFQKDADKIAAELINKHGVDPEQLDDIYFSIV